MPLRYRSEIKPHYHQWATEGFTKYEAYPATTAALALTDEVLNFKAIHNYAYERVLQNYMAHLRDSGVTARDVLIRMIELVGFLEANPTRLQGQRAEEYAAARLVLHLAPYTVAGKPAGARILKTLGPLVMQACYPYALGLVRKWNDDIAKRSALLRQAVDFGDLS
jgi:hypothetical protein